MRGDGDAQSIKIYADAFGQDKEFFAFYRSMQAYRDALNGRDTSFVLSPDSGFFRFFDDWTGGRHGDAARSRREPATAAPAGPRSEPGVADGIRRARCGGAHDRICRG